MKVTIAGMTEGFNSKTEFLAYTVYILNIWSDLVQRNNNVTFIKHFEAIFPVCLSFDSFQEWASCCPCIFDLCRSICNKNIDCTSFKCDFRSFFNNVVKFIFSLAVKCNKQVCTSFYTIDLLRIYALADISFRRLNNCFLHELESLRIKSVLLELRNCTDTIFQRFKRNNQTDNFLRCRNNLQSQFCDDT